MAVQAAGYEQTLEQQRASQAWRNVCEVATQSYAKEYRGLARQFPSYILTNGLAPALAFLKAKGEKQHTKLYDHIANWVSKQLKRTGPADLLRMLLDCDSYTYMQATEEALAFVTWLKRFAEAEIKAGD